MDPSKQPSFSIINTLSIVVVTGYAGLMPLWIFYPPTGVPDGVLAIINQMMGAWGMAFATVIAFHLGSSKGAKDAAEAQRGTVETLSATVSSTAATAATVANTAATVANTAAGVAATNGTEEAAFWETTSRENTQDAFDAYLAKFPTGAHATEARSRWLRATKKEEPK